MADYNVNMKQWNGTSFDNVLPLAYNAKQLEGQSLADVKQWVQDNYGKISVGSYRGVAKSGVANPTVLTFEFQPKFVIIYGIMARWSASNGLYPEYPFESIPYQMSMGYIGNDVVGKPFKSLLVVPVHLLTSSYKIIMYDNLSTPKSNVYAKINDKTLSIYSTVSAVDQMNSYRNGSPSDNNGTTPNYIYIAFA